jgi:AAA15 family ATPase/GTPase
MRIKKIRLKEFKRYDDLTIDLGENPKKIIALVGPNGSGKSSVFDAFEEKLKDFRSRNEEPVSFFSKSFFHRDVNFKKEVYNKNIAIAITTLGDVPVVRNSFYIRTAYRFTAKLNVNEVKKISDLKFGTDDPASSISLDTRLEDNYRRLLEQAYIQFDQVGTKTGNQVKEELIGRINKVLTNVIDVQISSLGNVMSGNGQLFFEKGNTINFPYSILSAGEKEVVDIIIDLVVKIPFYNDTVFCIDEPELHLNTAIQRKLLVEIEKLIPENCQLWIATHSIGFLRSLQNELKDKAQIFDFSERDYFNGTKVISPMRPNRTNWQRIFSTALDDLTDLLAPNRIIYCEGKLIDKRAHVEEGLDAKVFNGVFNQNFPETLFISSGGNTELDHRSDVAIAILGKVFSDIEIWILKDRDLNSGKPVDEAGRQNYLQNNGENHRVLKRFELENYLFDKEILKKYCGANSLNFNEEKYDSCFADIINDNIKDEIGIVKACCNLTGSINAEKFKLNLVEYITPDTLVYQDLVDCIFNRN